MNIEEAEVIEMKLENLWVYVDSQGNKHRLSGCGLKSESRRRLIEKIENEVIE